MDKSRLANPVILLNFRPRHAQLETTSWRHSVNLKELTGYLYINGRAVVSVFWFCQRRGEKRAITMPSSSPMTVFHLSLKISSERLKREEDELLPLPLMLQSKKRRLEAATKEEEKKAEKGGVFLPPPTQRLLLDLNEEPKEEEKKAKRGGVRGGVFLPPPPQRLLLNLKEEPKEEEKKAKKGGIGGGLFLPPLPQRLFLDLNEEPKEEEKKAKKGGVGGGVFLPQPPQRLFLDLNEESKEEEKKAKKGGVRGGGFLPPPPQRLFLDLNEEPNPMWEEMVNSGKPTVVFNRLLTGSDVRKDLGCCILNRTEMKEVLVPALREEERRQVYDDGKELRVAVVDGQYRKRYEMRMVWWRCLEQFALVKGWTELVHDNGLRKDDLIQLSYFRFGQQQQLGLLIQCRPEVQVMPQPDQDQDKDLQPLLD